MFAPWGHGGRPLLVSATFPDGAPLLKSHHPEQAVTVFVCQKSNCCKKGGDKVKARLKALVKEAGLKGEVRVVGSGCLDRCKEGPTVMVCPANDLYCGVKPGEAGELLERVAAELLEPA